MTVETEERPALTDLPLEGYEALAQAPGAKAYTPGQVRRWVLQRGALDFAAMTDLARPLRDWLSEHWRVRKGALERVLPSRDGTLGILTRLEDGRVIESVRIPEGRRATLCLSTQIGCAVRCTFCASGQAGVERNLSAGEILEQVLLARELSEAPLTNYVFMGSGEPTHNLRAFVQALRVMHSPEGLGIGARRITVSTVGHPEALARLFEVDIPFHVALSVHAADDALRDQLMPGLGRSRLAETLRAARARFDATGRRLTIEVVVLAGVNDAPQHARQLATLLAGTPAAVNLIPWNPIAGFDHRPPAPSAVQALARTLRAAGVPTTVRRPRGKDIGVACGQLRRHLGSPPGPPAAAG